MEFKLELPILYQQSSQNYSQTSVKKENKFGSLLENSRFYGQVWFNVVRRNDLSILIIYWMILYLSLKAMLIKDQKLTWTSAKFEELILILEEHFPFVPIPRILLILGSLPYEFYGLPRNH